ncbi:hypothetical protein VaNZ11_011499 [Volvox africanus]|uniref:Uncharacterized protein n=1 Tax=Volvox africanus TaxID=51714 RepID=A0ABQ5SCV2_9CHLO|nr:hypothetical protein VaNZ11_011499 [Volvox africanus]
MKEFYKSTGSESGPNHFGRWHHNTMDGFPSVHRLGALLRSFAEDFTTVWSQSPEKSIGAAVEASRSSTASCCSSTQHHGRGASVAAHLERRIARPTKQQTCSNSPLGM